MPGQLLTGRALPVTVIGGYLGAGKTTLINRILRHANGSRLAVLVNDFGDVSIDADLIESTDEQVMNLAGGCVCCSIGSDLVSSLATLHDRLGDIDHVLLETSGVALAGVVAATVALAPGVKRHAVVVVVDLLNGPRWLKDPYIGDTVARQIAAADLLLLNKHNLIDAQSADAFSQHLRALAPNAPQLLNDDGLPVATLLDFAQAAKSPIGTLLAPTRSADYVSTRFENEDATRLDQFKAWIESGGHPIIRAKGFLNDQDGKVWLVQVVGARCELRQWTQPAVALGQLIVITRQDDELERLASELAAFGLTPAPLLEQETS